MGSDAANRITTLEAEAARLRERCASDPWWWAFTEYIDEGWCGPFGTLPEAQSNALEASGMEDHTYADITYRQAHNPEGAAENERLARENLTLTATVARLREERDAALLEAAQRLEAMSTGEADLFERLRSRDAELDDAKQQASMFRDRWTAARDLCEIYRSELEEARKYAVQFQKSLHISNRKLAIIADVAMAREETDIDAAMGKEDSNGSG